MKHLSERKLSTFPLPNFITMETMPADSTKQTAEKNHKRGKERKAKKMKHQPAILRRLPFISRSFPRPVFKWEVGLVTLRAALETEHTFHARDLENIWFGLEGRADRDSSGNWAERERETLCVSLSDFVCISVTTEGEGWLKTGWLYIHRRWVCARTRVCVCVNALVNTERKKMTQTGESVELEE